MRCLACAFENPQQRAQCYRCGHMLDLSGLDLDPPRRGKVSQLIGSLTPRLAPRMWRGFRLWRIGARRAWAVSVVPGLGHALLGQRRWALGLAGAWLLACIPYGEVTLRPTGWVMMVQCVAMTEAFRQASLPRPRLSTMLLMSLLTSGLLALVEMICIGGILW